jgi:hypothetical protein
MTAVVGWGFVRTTRKEWGDEKQPRILRCAQDDSCGEEEGNEIVRSAEFIAKAAG